MATQGTGPWQTAGRPRQSNSSSRTPQNRSGTTSPNPQNSSQPPRQEPARIQPPNNVWTQRSVSSNTSNGSLRTGDASRTDAEQSMSGFNAAEVKAFLGRDAGVAAYKPAEGAGSTRASGGAWGSKPNIMANQQPFFSQLAKQIATLEGGG